LKPKILISSFSFPPENNGVSHAAFMHAGIMQSLGCEVDVVTRGDSFSREAQKCFSVTRFPISGNGRLFKPHRGSLKELDAFLRHNCWDIVFTHCWQAWSTNCLLDFFSRADRSEKLVLVSHGISTDSNFHPFPRNWLRRLLWMPYRVFSVPKYMRLIDRLVVLWDHFDDDRFLDHKIARSMCVPVSVIPNVARYDATSINRPCLKFTQEQLAGGFMLSVGNYSEEKNEFFVLEAYIRSRMTHVPLIFVGRQLNNYSAGLERHARQSGLNNVQFCERLSKEEIDWLYKYADLFLCGSKNECQPMVILDCFASRTVCVSRNVGCVRSFPGVVVVSNSDEMSASLRPLLFDSVKRQELADQGFDLYKKEFCFSAAHEKWGALLKQLLSQNQ